MKKELSRGCRIVRDALIGRDEGLGGVSKLLISEGVRFLSPIEVNVGSVCVVHQGPRG